MGTMWPLCVADSHLQLAGGERKRALGRQRERPKTAAPQKVSLNLEGVNQSTGRQEETRQGENPRGNRHPAVARQFLTG